MNGLKDNKIACFIPIKSKSERVPRKNFRLLGGEKLYERAIRVTKSAKCFDEIFVDTDSEEIKNFAIENGLKVIERLPELSRDTANGNDLLMHWTSICPEVEVFFQFHVTSPFITPEIIRACVSGLIRSKVHDSVFTATEERTWFWFNGEPVNYDPKHLPRSQDATPLIKETTSLYGITRKAFLKNRCRIGDNPMIYLIDPVRSIDIDNEVDLAMAESLINSGFLD